MTAHAEPASGKPRTRRPHVRGLLVLVIGCVAILSPFFTGTLAHFVVGSLLVVCGALEMLEIFQAADESRRLSAYLGGALSIVAGLLLLAQPQLLLRGLALFVAGTFAIDGIGKIAAAERCRRAGASWKWMLASGLVNELLALVLLMQWPVAGLAGVVILVGLCMLTTGWSILWDRADRPVLGPEIPSEARHPDKRLGLPPHEEFSKLQALLTIEDERRRIDAAWCWTFVIVFFAIHIGRMSIDRNLVGMISPLVAVVGDVATASLIAFLLILPCRLAWRKSTRPVERRGWKRLLARLDQGRGPGLAGRLCRGWLVGRLRFARRVASMRYSPRNALRWGLQVGLPLTAILIVVNPIWSFSWFFNSESWATGVWDHRTAYFAGYGCLASLGLFVYLIDHVGKALPQAEPARIRVRVARYRGVRPGPLL